MEPSVLLSMAALCWCLQFVALLSPCFAFSSQRPRLSVRSSTAADRPTNLTIFAGLFGERSMVEQKPEAAGTSVEWQIYIDQSKSSLDRGAIATLDAFCGLCPPSRVEVIAAILPKSNKKPPWVRCIARLPGRSSMDVASVDSVDKVYRILSKHLLIKEVSRDVCDCLKWKYKGNNYLESGKVGMAIDAYNKALEKCVADEKQEGVILLMRSSAYWQQAQSHKEVLQEAVKEWKPPEAQGFQSLLSEALLGGPERTGLASSILQKLHSNGRLQQSELQKIQYRHGLYQYSLLHATQDALRVTELLPRYSTCWLRAGELLGRLWKLNESRQYHEMAMLLDSKLKDQSEPLLEDLKRRQQLLDQLRANKEWPEDSLRLALDVTR